MIINIHELSKAIQSLHDGFLIVYPTDTLYALGADVFNKKAVEQVYRIKNRPFSMPLPVAVSTVDEIEDVAFINDNSRVLAEKFLPGPLTLILKKKKCVPDIVTSKGKNVAVRIPSNDIALRLLSEFGPVTVTSANIHGEKTPGVINDVKMQFKQKDIAFYLDDGRLEGKPSSIVDVTSDEIKIIREGVISKDKILDVI